LNPIFNWARRAAPQADGIGDFELSGKYAFVKWLRPISTRAPESTCAFRSATLRLDMTDGFNHYTPYFSVSSK
jgi:hypothetical protein